MKIKGSLPQPIMTKSKGKIVVKVKGHLKGSLLGSAPGATTTTVSKWPAKRPGRLPLITQQQQTTWDIVQVDIKSPEPSEFASAIAATQGTAFYTRDILILAEYGHYLSWPGWGPYPQGCLIFPTTLGLTAGGGMKNRPLGLPQKVNGITTLAIDNSSDPVKIDVTTHRPADPELAIWCCAPNPCLKFKKALGVFLPHGSKLFLPCDPTYYTTARSSPGAYGWDIACADLKCDHCQFAIIERSITPPIVEWTSQLHDCPSCTPIVHGGDYFSYYAVIVNAFFGHYDYHVPGFINSTQSVTAPVLDRGQWAYVPDHGTMDLTINGVITSQGFTLTGYCGIEDAFTGTVYCTGNPVTATPGSPGTSTMTVTGIPIPSGGANPTPFVEITGVDGFGYVGGFGSSMRVTRH
jgi:hypothetical protein